MVQMAGSFCDLHPRRQHKIGTPLGGLLIRTWKRLRSEVSAGELTAYVHKNIQKKEK